jgi:uncharacterized protein YlxP (DUF503 family)
VVIGALELRLVIIGARSLKEKRKVLKSLKDRISRMNVSVAEVGDNDKWQAATLGITLVSNEVSFVNSVIDKIVQGMEESGEVEILSSRIEIMHL